MGNRQLPKAIEESDFDQKIAFLELFFGSQWLNSKTSKTSIIKELWSRRDHLASTELYTVAEALQGFDKPENQKWISAYKKLAKISDNQATISRTYELLSARMFDTGEQKVCLADVHQPGYDFVIKAADKAIRVSCKRLTSSQSEKRFYKESAELYAFTLAALKHVELNGIQILLSIDRSTRDISTNEIKKMILHYLQVYKNRVKNFNRKISAELPAVFLEIAELPVDLEGWQFSPNHTSLIFICYSPYSRKEQERFEDLFLNAAKNLKKKGGMIDENSANVIMIGLPVCVSLAQAREWLSRKFEKEHTSITGVWLNRLVPAKDKRLEATYIVNEIAFVDNPLAKSPITSFLPGGNPLRMKTTANFISQNGSELWLNFGDEHITVENKYFFQRGEVFHEHKHTLGEVRYGFASKSGIKHHAIFHSEAGKGAFMLSNICPPEEALVIL